MESVIFDGFLKSNVPFALLLIKSPLRSWIGKGSGPTCLGAVVSIEEVLAEVGGFWEYTGVIVAKSNNVCNNKKPMQFGNNFLLRNIR